jgi:dienelactone hydrolase
MNIHGVTDRFRRLTAVIAAVLPTLVNAADNDYRVFKPRSEGPYRAVVFLPGCTGFSPSGLPQIYTQPAERLQNLGYLVVWADYVGESNLKDCSTRITQEAAVQKALDAGRWTRARADVDPAHVFVIGWSYGGGAVLKALGKATTREPVFDAAAVYYPHCESVQPWSLDVPVLVLQAGSDDIVNNAACDSATKSKVGSGGVKIVTLPGALHSFDFVGLPRMKWRQGSIGYDRASAEAAWNNLTQFLSTIP